MASPSLETLMTLSPTPPLPERSPYRRPSGYDKPLPPLPDDFFQLETELVPKPLFSRMRTLPSKAIHVATIELPSPGVPSPIIYPSDISTVASNRSSIVSVASSRPSTAATSVPSEAPSRTSSFTQTTPLWAPPRHVPKPMLGRSATLPTKRTFSTTARFASLFPSSAARASASSTGPATPSIPPPRSSPQTCFSPPPMWPPPMQDIMKPHFSRSATLPPTTPQRGSLDLPTRPLSDICHAETPMRICPLSLPPPRTSPLTCFSPEPVGPRVAMTPTRPTLRRKETPRKETLRSLRAKDSDICMRRSLDLPRSSFMGITTPEKPAPVEKIQFQKPKKSPSNLGQYTTYAMDEKGVFIIRG
ncbi:hypothetical protein CC86DRAFT_374855 [Ophiobolus disseminans]|uniref:Uncharacterized protein n=1 Tax=Ophiobolus disseminans TaxID=1469910 RepID=A0A6A6ZFB1_9PLEO|nr:hypothetical protein CC86DRAFT_374855 [Ophiobolus disseminans]